MMTLYCSIVGMFFDTVRVPYALCLDQEGKCKDHKDEWRSAFSIHQPALLYTSCCVLLLRFLCGHYKKQAIWPSCLNYTLQQTIISLFDPSL